MQKNTKKTQGKGREYVNILGISVSITSETGVLAGVKDFITDSVKFFIVTPNPELVLSSTQDIRLKEALNSADFAVPDGVGLKLAAPGLNIIKGRELFLELVKLANDEGWKVFFLGGLDNEASLAIEKLKTGNLLKIDNWKLKTESAKGPKLSQKGEPATEIDRKLQEDAVDKINKFAPDLLFVAFGNPKQEIWIHQNLSRLNIKGAMAVGGTLRYVAGLSKLPPKWMEKLGLEWLYRLITEPYRVKRIFQAVVIFPLAVFWYKVANSWRAR